MLRMAGDSAQMDFKRQSRGRNSTKFGKPGLVYDKPRHSGRNLLSQSGHSMYAGHGFNRNRRT